MRFGPVLPAEAEGAILAHSLTLGTRRLKKGHRLGPGEVAALVAAGIGHVTVARLAPDDVPEDEAARTLGAALAPDPGALGLTVSAPFTGRVNLFAAEAGILRVDAGQVDRLNDLDPAITLATLPDLARVPARGMVATIKIIPYAVGRAALDRALAILGPAPIRLHPFRPLRAALILTRTEAMKHSVLAKGEAVVMTRLRALGLAVEPPRTVPHEVEAVARALAATRAELVLILTASATADANDTAPAGLLAAGGRLERFGMPVDPGNLLFLGALGQRIVVGLPGCARSPALNGADWVLERLAAGLPVTGSDLARMGVGGLLKEVPSRGQPRAAKPRAAAGRPLVEAVLLAAGAGRRMGGSDKLLQPIGAEPLLAGAARAALASRADRVLVVLPPGAAARREALGGLPVALVEAPDAGEGMAASLRAGLAAVSPEADAVVLMFADMPEVEAEHVDRLIAAFDPEEGRDICRAVDAAGRPGHPVLFGRRFFESLAALTGDRGARDILAEAAEHVVDVPTPGQGATLDLDTPAQWARWCAERSS